MRIAFPVAVAICVAVPQALSAQPAVPSMAEESAAAAAVVQDYYAALAARDFRRAYASWADGGAASGKGLAGFANGFAHTRSTAVRIVSASPPDGAAGSMYVTVMVEVEATLDSGVAQRFTGTYTLRRVNGVPGATAEQLSWHIASAELHPAG
ncbi:hypothetical protein [Sandaracinobacteroides hominis]|uniref:hypothetical protein n=1 Tax=Sandaracinobacteroides hominis TaxID=2780086 RepID=UPI0018F6EE5F|nr:hypothetical protein [Sandaracinobacteroides hominis]